MPLPKDINEYVRAWAPELGERILQTYPPLQGFDDVASPLTGQLLRKPFPAQTLALMGVVKRWTEARGAAVIAECGTGKTLISLGAVHVHSDRKPFTALAMVPPQLVEKWAREAFQTLPRVRVFFIDGLRTPASSVGHVGISEVRLRSGRIIREGLPTTLTELRQRKTARTASALGFHLRVPGSVHRRSRPREAQLLLATCVHACSMRALPRERRKPGHGLPDLHWRGWSATSLRGFQEGKAERNSRPTER